MTGSNLAVSGRRPVRHPSAGTTRPCGRPRTARTSGIPFQLPAGLGLGGIAAASSWQVAFLCGASEGTYHSAEEVLLSVTAAGPST